MWVSDRVDKKLYAYGVSNLVETDNRDLSIVDFAINGEDEDILFSSMENYEITLSARARNTRIANAAVPSTIRWYSSSDSNISGGDTELGSTSFPHFGSCLARIKTIEKDDGLQDYISRRRIVTIQPRRPLVRVIITMPVWMRLVGKLLPTITAPRQ